MEKNIVHNERGSDVGSFLVRYQNVGTTMAGYTGALVSQLGSRLFQSAWVEITIMPTEPLNEWTPDQTDEAVNNRF